MKFQVLNEIPQKDGSLILECDIDEEWKQSYLKATGKKRATKRGMEKYVLECIQRGLELDKEIK